MNPAVLDLRELPLKTGERAERTVPLDSYPIFLGGQRYEVVPKGEGVDIRVERIHGGYLMTVSLEAMLYGACFRCLREIAHTVEARQQEFVPANPEKWDEEEVSPFIDEFVIDVEGLAREAVVLALPEKLLCTAECRGICPVCGLDRNVEECTCEEEAGDPRWEKLRELRLESGEEEDQQQTA